MAIQVVIAATGFRAIARFERWTVPVTLVVLLAMTIVAWTHTGVHWGYAGGGPARRGPVERDEHR